MAMNCPCAKGRVEDCLEHSQEAGERPTATYVVVYECGDGFLDDITIKAFNDHDAREIAADSIEEGAIIKEVRLVFAAETARDLE